MENALCSHPHVFMGGFKQLLRIMKISTFLLFAAFLQVSARGYTQRITLSETDAPLVKAFRDIRQRTGYSFLYTTELLKNRDKVTFTLTDATLEDALTACFKNQPLTWELDGNTVIVKPAAVTAPPVPQAPPGNEIRGRVVDENGKPLAGASVMVRGTHQGTLTNAEGWFILHSVPGNAILEIGYTGYIAGEVKAGTGEELIIRLKPGENKLDQLVVKGYYSTSKRLNTGNVSTVDGAQIANQSVTNPMQALQGMVPGLFIQQATGLPGSLTKVLLRGQNSLSAGTVPLYIIDGVPYNGTPVDLQMMGGMHTGNQPNGGTDPLAQFNPADIESIQVLKDADAISIYGSRGANGVVIITTKRSAAGATRVDLNATQGWGHVTHLVPLVSTAQALAIRKKAFADDGITPTAENAPDLVSWSQTQNTNYEKLLIGNTSHITDAGLGFSGGNKNTSILIDGAYHTETSVILGGNGYTKGTIHMKGDHTSTDGRFKMSMTANYSADKNHMPFSDISLSSTTYPGNLPLYNPDGSLHFDPQVGNPIAGTRSYYKTNTNNLILNSTLSYSILPNLTLRTNLGLNSIQLDQMLISPPSASDPASPDPGSGFYMSNLTRTSLVEPQVDYNAHIGPGKLNVTAGGTYQYSYFDEPHYIIAFGFPAESLIENYSEASMILINKSFDAKYKYASVFGRAGYNLFSKYILNLTFRRDGSSRFGPGRQYGNFGSVGAAWVFSSETFAKDLGWLSYGKLRGSYGTAGNDQIPNYGYLDTYSAAFANYGSISSFVPSRIANPYYGWETSHKLEFGLELGFLNNNLMITGSWFRNRSSSQLQQTVLPAQTGFTTYTANLPALVQNQGEELEINATLMNKKTFSWKASFNITRSRNKLVSYPELENSSYSNMYIVGQPLNLVGLYHFTGFVNGAATVKDVNKDGRLVPGLAANGNGDYVDAGTTDPRFYGGFNNTLRYKQFQLDVFFNFVDQKGYGITAFPGLLTGSEFNGILHSGFAPSTLGSSDAYNSYNNYYINSDANFVNASYLRLRNLTASWYMPEAWQKRIRMSNGRLFVSGQNLLTFTSYKGFDPETQSGMMQTPTGPVPQPAFPPLRIVSLGLQCSF